MQPNVQKMKKVGAVALQLLCLACLLDLQAFQFTITWESSSGSWAEGDSQGETAHLPECRPRGTFAGQQIKRLLQGQAL